MVPDDGVRYIYMLFAVPLAIFIWQLASGLGKPTRTSEGDSSCLVTIFKCVIGYLGAWVLFYAGKNPVDISWIFYVIPVIFLVILFIVVRFNFEEAINEVTRTYEHKVNDLQKECRDTKREYQKRKEDLEKIHQSNMDVLKNKEMQILRATQGEFPFKNLASAAADIHTIMFDDGITYLSHKKNPAYSSAEVVRKLKDQAKEYQMEYKLMLYRYEFLLNQFPELENYVESIDDIRNLSTFSSLSDVEQDYDKVRDWLSKEEYDSLSVDQRNQLALDNYIKRSKKSKWQVGRDYELYIGYLYRQQGWDVTQFGEKESLGDMGRDVIAKLGRTIHIIQCKRWSTDKLIHENVICQLYGTSIQYELDLPYESNSLFGCDVIPVLVTTAELSETAQRFANKLGVVVKVIPMNDNFPRIKCNINNGQRIYHLPFDQQYDRVQIDKEGEFYAMTVQEAVSKGFRRAHRFMGLSQGNAQTT